jgi:membrane-bound lytic murein transglycosylase D
MGSRGRTFLPLLAALVLVPSASLAAPDVPSAAPPPKLPAPAPAPTRVTPSPAAPPASLTPPPAAQPAPQATKPPAPPAPQAQAAKPAAQSPRAAAPPPRPAKPGPSTNAKPATKSAAAAVAKPTRPQESNVRRMVAGGPTFDDTAMGADTPELRALYAAERELFAPTSPQLGTAWPQELPWPLAAGDDRPRVHASGLPPAPPLSTPPHAEGAKDLSWLAKLDLPDLPVRWDPRVVRYLEFFKDDPRGRSTLTIWLRRSGRYRDQIRKVLRKKGLPEDLTWLAMIESGFEPSARSPVGALGLWQFMPETGKIYGLSQDRWADQRMSLSAATEAAADFLGDLYRRFGSWDLAMAAYNMGYGGVLSVVRRYNTNDYWALAKLEGSLPWETTLYVPKILAAAVVAKNLAAFGFADVAVEPPLEGEDVPVAPGTALASVAQACGVTQKEVEQLNPELRASRTPPAQEDWPVKVPAGKASGCSQALSKAKKAEPASERYVVRFGESLEQIAQARHVPVARLVELNGIAPGEVVRGGTVLLVPKDAAQASDKPAPPKASDKAAVIVPPDVFVYPDRRRVFYRVQVGDTLRDVSSAFKVTPDELRRWNEIDPSARLVDGMTLQLFVPPSADLTKTVVLGEGDVRTLVAGTDEFFQHWDEKGRRRLVLTAKAGDTLESIGKRHGVSTALMERINRRGRSAPLAEGDQVIVYAPGNGGTASSAAQASNARPGNLDPLPTAPLAAPPAPDLLPDIH